MEKEKLTDAQQQTLKALIDAVIEGNEDQTLDLVKQGLEQKIPALTILEEAMTPAIREVGERFNRMELFLPEMITCAETMQAGVKILEPYFDSKDATSKGKIVLGTIKGDIHDIGKNIFKTMLEVNGYKVVDLGRDIAPATFVDEAEKAGAQIIAISGLLTTSMPLMRDTVKILVDEGMRSKYKVIIGGGPTSQEFADRIGADGYGDTAHEGILLCNRLLNVGA